MIRKENLEEMLKVIGYVRDAHEKIYEIILQQMCPLECYKSVYFRL